MSLRTNFNKSDNPHQGHNSSSILMLLFIIQFFFKSISCRFIINSHLRNNTIAESCTPVQTFLSVFDDHEMQFFDKIFCSTLWSHIHCLINMRKPFDNARLIARIWRVEHMSFEWLKAWCVPCARVLCVVGPDDW